MLSYLYIYRFWCIFALKITHTIGAKQKITLARKLWDLGVADVMGSEITRDNSINSHCPELNQSLGYLRKFPERWADGVCHFCLETFCTPHHVSRIPWINAIWTLRIAKLRHGSSGSRRRLVDPLPLFEVGPRGGGTSWVVDYRNFLPETDSKGFWGIIWIWVSFGRTP